MAEKRMIEISVQEAANEIGVSPRSILNYIGLKEIDAIKVGKLWFIRRPSFDAFKKRHRFPSCEKSHEVAGHQPLQLQGQAQTQTQEQAKSTVEVAEEKFDLQKKKNLFSIYKLRLFQLFREQLPEEMFPKNLVIFRRRALRLLGAGYYSYDREMKVRFYKLSRAQVGSMLALFYDHRDRYCESVVLMEIVEGVILPAYASLIKKMEGGICHEKDKGVQRCLSGHNHDLQSDSKLS